MTALPSVPIGVWKGIVVVAVPVEITVCTVILVGRMNAEAVADGAGTKYVPTGELSELPPPTAAQEPGD